MNLEDISIQKCLSEIESIEKKYQISLCKTDALSIIHRKFLSKFSHDNNGISIDAIRMNDDDKNKLRRADTYKEVKNILEKYVKDDTKKMRMGQLNRMSIAYNIYDSEIKKLGNSYSAWDYRNKQPIPVIQKFLEKKTEKYIQLHTTDSVYNYEFFNQLSELLHLMFGISINHTILSKKYRESNDDYQDRLNREIPQIEWKTFKNGNIRITMKNKTQHNMLRQYFIEDEINSIIRNRK